MTQQIKGVVGEKSIMLHYDGESITIQSETDRLLFEEFKYLMNNNATEELIKRFIDVKARIEAYTDKTFYIEKGNLHLKGDDTPIPELLARKLLELESTGEDFMPLVRFWKKLKQNPSEESIEQLYGFIEANEIPITEMGDIVTEKGVKQRSGAPVGELVDDYTGAIDNSIGMEVSMAREDVDDDRDVTCSHGLHVGAPKYVREFYQNKIIVQCIVNPRDVVAVPSDYNDTKMRVCRYIVAGYSTKTNESYKPVYNLRDFINSPEPEVKEKMESLSSRPESTKRVDEKVTSTKADMTFTAETVQEYMEKLSEMTGRKILELVKEELGIELPHSPKSKKAIVKKAATLFVEASQE